MTRRDFVLALAGSAATVGGLAGCAQRAPAAVGPAVVGRDGQAKSDVPRATGDPADASASVHAFTADLYRELAGSAGNLVCSPYSVAVALAMTRNGARGDTAAEMDRVLHTGDPLRLNAGLGATEALLETRSGPVRTADGTTAELSLRIANSLWGQHDVAWQTAFLDTLARDYGAGMRLVDYRTAAEPAREQINAWTGEQTRGKIDELIPPGALNRLTRLVLVNAVYLKAPWRQPFAPDRTRAAPFTRPDGSIVQAPTMTEEIVEARYGRVDGWQAVELRYAGDALAMTVVLPDRALAEFDARLDEARLAQVLGSVAPVGRVALSLPKWTFRTGAALKDALSALGMPTAFAERKADFSGMAAAEKLLIDDVLHEGFIAVDEAGTEAAAATAVMMRTESMPVADVEMVVDRPFLFVIHDVATAVPLFIGRVTDPTDS